MRCCARLRLSLSLPWLGCLLLLSNVLFDSAYASTGHFSVREAHTRLVEEVYRLDAYFDYVFNDTLHEALLKGVSLTVVVLIEVKRERPYWLDASIASIRQQYRLSYQGLTRQYMVHHLNTGIQENFNSLSAALEMLRVIEELPLLDKHLVKGKYPHNVHIQTYLDIEALPPPLQPVAYFSKDWRLSSNEYTCPLSE
jgi:hypothetical protein